MDLPRDLIYVGRGLRRSPGFTATVVFTLALGIGAATCLFTIVDGFLLRPLPYPDPGRLVRISSVNESGTGDRSSWADLDDWRNQSSTLSNVAAYWPIRATLRDSATTTSVSVAMVTPGFFTVFGSGAMQGRFCDAPREAVISAALWHGIFHGVPDIVGRPVLMGGKVYTVVGVVTPQFRYPGLTDVWVPLSGYDSDDRLADRGGRYLAVVGRMKPDIPLRQVQANLDTLARQLAARYPASNREIHQRVISLRDAEVDDLRPYLVLVLLVSGALVAIGCGNVANLLLARSLKRTHEIAIRLSLGAMRTRIMREFLIEGIVLAGMGWIAGMVVAQGGLVLFDRLPIPKPAWLTVSVDLRVLGFSLALSLVASLIFSLAPALRAWRLTPAWSVRGQGSLHGGRSASGLGDAIVAVQLAVTLVLVVAGGLLAQTMRNLGTVDPGFRSARLVIAGVAPDESGDRQPSLRMAYIDRVELALRNLPGVESVGLTNALPNTADAGLRMVSDVTVMRSGVVDTRRAPSMLFSAVTPDYFHAMGIPLIEGRSFSALDDAHATAVALVSRRTAAWLWPGQDAIGRRIRVGDWKTVVGVVGDVKYHASEPGTGLELYLPAAQNPPGHLYFAVRTSADAGPLVNPIRRTIARVDPGAAVTSVETMDELQGVMLWRQRLWGSVALLFAVSSVVLAAFGVFAISSFAVARRRHEVAIRMAVGAQRYQVVAGIVAGTLRCALAGIACGGVGAMIASRLLTKLLFGVGAHDPATFAIAVMSMLGIATVASFLPARRAATVDAAEVLRAQ